METNKIVGALCGALLVYLGLNFFGEQIFYPHHSGEELAYALEIEEDVDTGDEEGPSLGELLAAADIGKGEKVFKKCAACHKIEDGANGAGPHLWSVINREIGSVGGFNYSGALPAGESWTAANLDAFLERPKKWAPGTSMGFAGLKKPEDRAALIAYLNGRNNKSVDSIVAQITADQICASALKNRPPGSP